MGFGIALLTLLGVGLVFSFADDNDGDDAAPAAEASEPGEVIDGTPEGDSLEGTANADTIEGGSGNDVIEGGDGNDVLRGQADQDIVVAGAGNDVVAGGSGSDFLIGGDGSDTMSGSLGADWLEGDDGNDTLNAGFGDDTLLGGTGADTLDGGAGNDLLIGTAVQNTPFDTDDIVAFRNGDANFADVLGVPSDVSIPLPDDDAADVLNGGDGSDDVVLGAGDTGTGGAGEDIFVVLAEAGTSQNGPSVITDFDGGSDALLVLSDPDDPTPPVLSIVNENGDAIVTVNGVPVSILQGAAGQIESDDISGVTGIFVGFLDPS